MSDSPPRPTPSAAATSGESIPKRAVEVTGRRPRPRNQRGRPAVRLRARATDIRQSPKPARCWGILQAALSASAIRGHRQSVANWRNPSPRDLQAGPTVWPRPGQGPWRGIRPIQQEFLLDQAWRRVRGLQALRPEHRRQPKPTAIRRGFASGSALRELQRQAVARPRGSRPLLPGADPRPRTEVERRVRRSRSRARRLSTTRHREGAAVPKAVR